ncbi:hypothetical protein M9H77_34258 [Catharanthus roseus]|uniref:Uncharacterized protein n=1 Tax=Catharanthus roseus TaxID=4058 RepID=A0ACB9ZLD4_CATRO|nr:hypothetical protein M9H77_34258 [Catharanthus roseus]
MIAAYISILYVGVNFQFFLLKMSSGSSNSSDNSFEVEELLQIRTRCKELRREKDLLQDSKSQSFELIRGLELHVKALSEAQKEDKKCILQLEKELNNCSQEIDYLQDQLNARNSEVNCLEEHVCSLQSELLSMQNQGEEVLRLREELNVSHSERLLLKKALENKDMELQNARLCIEKLEESISSAALDYQCEVESMKLDLLAMEQNCFDARKSQEEASQENARMNKLIQDLQSRIQNEEKVIECLDKENKSLKEKLKKSEMNAKVFREKVEKQLQGQLGEEHCTRELGEDSSACGNILGPLISKLAAFGDVGLKENMDKMLCQIQDYELLVGQLKEELKEERLRAKEEAEDLAQEMAELRYRMTGLLEEECKRRACVEQISLQRISELEAELEKERCKSFDHQENRKSITTLRHVRAS